MLILGAHPWHAQERAAAYVANDWFLNTLDGMLGGAGFDPTATSSFSCCLRFLCSLTLEVSAGMIPAGVLNNDRIKMPGTPSMPQCIAVWVQDRACLLCSWLAHG